MHNQRIWPLAGLIVTVAGGVTLFMDEIIIGALGLAGGALIGVAGLISIWTNNK